MEMYRQVLLALIVEAILTLPQLVVAGDFFQLPPVPDKNIEDDKKREVSFAFESPSWKKALVKSAVLTRVFRQKDEGVPSPRHIKLAGDSLTETQRLSTC